MRSLRSMRSFAAILLLILAAGCASTPATRYPWHGPLVDPNGNPPPEPSYETIHP